MGLPSRSRASSYRSRASSQASDRRTGSSATAAVVSEHRSSLAPGDVPLRRSMSEMHVTGPPRTPMGLDAKRTQSFRLRRSSKGSLSDPRPRPGATGGLVVGADEAAARRHSFSFGSSFGSTESFELDGEGGRGGGGQPMRRWSASARPDGGDGGGGGSSMSGGMGGGVSESFEERCLAIKEMASAAFVSGFSDEEDEESVISGSGRASSPTSGSDEEEV